MAVDYFDLGIRIRKKREKVGISQAELAGRSNLSTQHICNVENARTKASLETVVTIANVFECSIDELVCGSMKACRTVYQNEVAVMMEDFSDMQMRLLPEFLRHYSYTYNILQKAIDKDEER